MDVNSEKGERDKRVVWGGVTWGLILIAVGGALLADRFLDIPREFWWSSWWTFVVMGFGIVSIVKARDAKSLGEGVGCVLFGVWLWVSMTGWMGLNWSRSWPLILIAIGAQELTRAIASRWMPVSERKEARRG
jgi:hypothetical protein